MNNKFNDNICITNYDWIGFDLDHCLIRYKLDKINELIFNGMISYLTEDEEKSKKYDLTVRNYKYDPLFNARGAIFDKENGNLLKLDELKNVIIMTHGLNTCTDEEIKKLYPVPIKEFDGNRTKQFHPLVTFFDVPGGYLLAVLIDYLDKKYGEYKHSYAELFNDLISGYQANFNEFGKGWYFPILSSETDMGKEIANYIYKREEIKLWLRELRRMGKKIFVLTNSRIDYTNLLLSYAFGNDWLQEFDIVVTYAKKGNFFNEKEPFKNVCLNNLYETNDINKDELKCGHVYAHGNSTDFHEFLRKNCETSNPKVLYFGDHILTDIYDSRQCTNWNTVAIVEELEWFAPNNRIKSTKRRKYSLETYLTPNMSNKFDNLFIGNENNSFWMVFMKNYAHLIIPDISFLTKYPINYEYKMGFVYDVKVIPNLIGHLHLPMIYSAHDRIKKFVHKTPVLTCSAINDMVKCEVYFKCENLQKVGAFKFRGAMNTMIKENNKTKTGVITHSSGNHAQALSLSAKLLNIDAVVVMPENAPSCKVDATKGYGAEVIRCESSASAREEMCNKVKNERNLHFIPPYDNINIIHGAGTAALELLNEVEVDYMFVPIGGGGLCSGTALACKGFNANINVIGAEPKNADDAYRSFHSTDLLPQKVSKKTTIADGLRTPLSSLTLSCIRNNVDDIQLVDEHSILKAMQLLWERMKIVVEPSGAVPLAALIKRREIMSENYPKVGIIISGGNIDLECFFSQLHDKLMI